MITSNILIVSILYLFLFVAGEFAFHYLKFNGESSRKLVHFGSGIIGLFLPQFISSHWVILSLAIVFIGILFFSKQWNFLPSINSVERNTLGSTLFPLVLYLCFLSYTIQHNLLFYYTPILILSICDPLAAIVGKRWAYGKYFIRGNTKTLGGSLIFMVTSAAILFFMLLKMTESTLLHIFVLTIVISLIATITEGLSINGFDNLTVPLAVLGTLMLLL